MTPADPPSLQTFRNVLNNELTTTATTRHAICPSTEEPLWEVPVSTQEDVDRAVSAGKVAFRSWSKLSQDERAGYLNKFADAIEANKQELIELLGKEVGKPPQAGGFELFLVMGLARGIPEMRLKDEKVIDDADVRDSPDMHLAALANSPSSALPSSAMFPSVWVSVSSRGTSPSPLVLASCSAPCLPATPSSGRRRRSRPTRA